MKFSGTLKDSLGQPRTGSVGTTFAFYADREGGAPLWAEVQTVQLDDHGRYAVFLGESQSGGLPLELFTTGEARWLGVQVDGEQEQPRVLLVSVPFALKAADAETLAGRPVSAFVLAESNAGTRGGAQAAASGTATASVVTGGGSGTLNVLAKFQNADTLVDSALFESGGAVGLGTMAPAAPLHIGSTQAYRSLNLGSLQTGFYPGIMLENTATNRQVGLSENNGLWVFTHAGAGNFTGSDARLVLDTAGRLGLGTTTPTAPLHIGAIQTYRNLNLGSIQTGSYPGILIENTSTNKQVALNENNGLVIYTHSGAGNFAASDARVFLDTAGNLGIGTMTPSTTLEVAGNLRVSGMGNGVIFPDGSTQITAATGGAPLNSANTFTVGPQTMETGGASNKGVIVKGAANQTANLQEWQDSTGATRASVNSAGAFLGPLGMILHHASFQGADQTLTGGGLGSITPKDGLLFIQTGLATNYFADVVSHAATTTLESGLDRPGAFLSLRLHSLSNPVVDGRSYVLAGGRDGGGTPIANGFGFKITDSGALKGVTRLNGTETEVDLATTLSSLVNAPPVDLLAVRRASSVEFYVGGVLKASSTTNLPTEAYSIYEIRLINSTTNMGYQGVWVSHLTVAIPMF